MPSVETYDIVPRGPFSLEAARTFAGGFAAGIGAGGPIEDGIVMAFPVEGWQGSAVAPYRMWATVLLRVGWGRDAVIEALRESETSPKPLSR